MPKGEIGNHRMRALIAIALIIPLCGCGVIGDAVQASESSEVKKFDVKDIDTFRIIEDAEESRITIEASPMRIVGAELNDIFTFGTSYSDMPETIMKSAALGYLQSTGRQCSIEEEKKLSRMLWEFKYQCRLT